MENSKIALKEIISNDAISIDKIKCSNVKIQGIIKHMKINEELAYFVLVMIT